MGSPIDSLVRSVLRMPAVEEHPSQFGPAPAYWVEGREFLHVDADGMLDLRLTRALYREHRARLRDDARVATRGGDWIQIAIKTKADAGFALELIGLAAAANRRKPGERARPEPTDKLIAARRAQHRSPKRS